GPRRTCGERPIRPPKTQKGPHGPFANRTGGFLADLEDEQQRDDERVDDERLDQREAKNHRAVDLLGSSRVARDALERRAGRAALADAAAERGETDAEACAERDQAVVRREAVELHGLRVIGALCERDAAEQDEQSERRKR